MNSNKTKNKTVVHIVILAAIMITTWSCNDSGNTGDSKTGDSSIMNNRNADTIGQNRIGNDSANSGNSASNHNSSNAGTSNNNNAGMESDFLMKVAEINMEEIKLGKLAEQKGTMKHVKELGKMMVTEHTQAMEELKTLSKSKAVIIPTTETNKITEDYKMLNAKSGKDFDKAYSDMMVQGHKEAIALFEKTNSETKDADIKAMTTAMIPKLKTHLDHSEMCAKECAKM